MSYACSFSNQYRNRIFEIEFIIFSILNSNINTKNFETSPQPFPKLQEILPRVLAFDR